MPDALTSTANRTPVAGVPGSTSTGANNVVANAAPTAPATGQAMPEHSFPAKPGDTIWAQVRGQMDKAGMFAGMDPKAKDVAIGEMVKNAKVYNAKGEEIKDKNLIFAGKNYRIVFPGVQPPQPATTGTGDAFRPNGGGTPTPPAGGGTPTTGGAAPAGRSGQVAAGIAQQAATWNYDFALQEKGRTFQEGLDNADNFDKTRLGVCTDIAFKAAKMFEQQGIDARVVGGKAIDSNGKSVNHAWVEYMGEDGKFHRFDPTNAASSKNPNSALTPEDDGFTYLEVSEMMDDVNKDGAWELYMKNRSNQLITA